MGQEAGFDQEYAAHKISDEQLTYEEYMRSIALWERDYWAKPHRSSQGYVVSLSGGKDSGYGAESVVTMIDLDVQENGIEGFFQRFDKLEYKDEVLEIYAREGKAATVRKIKDCALTCVYLATENSSDHTLNAARVLIEGGTLPDGTHTDGIGGKFYVVQVQPILDEAIISFTGMDLTKIATENLTQILGHKFDNDDNLTSQDLVVIARAKLVHQIKEYINAKPGEIPELPAYVADNCVMRLPTWANPEDDITLQNIQARVRLSIPWTIANQEHKIPLVTSNESEAVHSYTTAGGDMHMGGANPIGGVPKDVITKTLLYLENHGLVGVSPVKSLYWINHEKPSAELRKVVEGQAEQTDESDLGFTYEQSKFIEQRLIVGRQTPLEVLPQMRQSNLFSSDLPELRAILTGFTRRWEAGQFKRIMGALAPHVGSNVDPHQAVRTTVLGDHFRTGCADMTLEIVAEMVGGANKFEERYGFTPKEARIVAGVNADMKEALISWPMGKLLDAENWKQFQAANDDILQYFPRAQAHPTILAPA